MKTWISKGKRTTRSRAALLSMLIASLACVSSRGSPRAPRADDCVDPSTQKCRDNLTQNIHCIIGFPTGGCVVWEAPCCDDIQDDDSLDVTIVVTPGEWLPSSFALEHTTAGCPYYKAFCGPNDPSCEHETFYRWLRCHDQYRTAYDHCPQ